MITIKNSTSEEVFYLHEDFYSTYWLGCYLGDLQYLFLLECKNDIFRPFFPGEFVLEREDFIL